ncbi:MAG: YciI family protein [bacterium]
MPKYALILPHAADRYSNLPADEYAEIMQDYFAWVQRKVADGSYQGGNKLRTDEGRFLTTRNGDLEVHEIPSTEIAEVVGGIMILEMADLNAVVEAVRDHPHLKHNQNIVVLPIDPTTED